MSFRCGICDDSQPDGSKPVKIVTERRGKRNGGWEIVKEVDACVDCAAKHEESNN